jgi:hypothetical protein
MTMGEEGVTFDTNEAGERVYKNANGSLMANPTIQTLEEQYGLWNGSSYVMASKDSPYFTFTPEEAEAQVIGSKGGFLTAAPSVTIDQDYANDYNDLYIELQNEIKQYCQNFIKNGYTKADWEAQCAKWDNYYGYLFDILNGNV